jgi:hypothetical protein
MSEDKKKSITVALLGNEPKHCYARLRLLLKFRDFMNWVDINQRRRNLRLC